MRLEEMPDDAEAIRESIDRCERELRWAVAIAVGLLGLPLVPQRLRFVLVLGVAMLQQLLEECREMREEIETLSANP